MRLMDRTTFRGAELWARLCAVLLASVFGICLAERGTSCFAEEQRRAPLEDQQVSGAKYRWKFGGSVRSENEKAIPRASVSVIAVRVVPFPSMNHMQEARLLQTVVTDAAGSFEFPGVELPADFVRLAGEDEISLLLMIRAAGFGLAWQRVQDGLRWEAKLSPERKISGMLVNSRNFPLARMPVRVVEVQPLKDDQANRRGTLWLRRLTVAPETQTDAQGCFILDGMPAEGIVKLAVGPNPAVGAVLAVRLGEAEKLANGAQRSRPRNDEEFFYGASFQAKLEDSREILGQVTYAESGLPAPGATIYLSPVGYHTAGAGCRLVCDQHGKYRLPDFYGRSCNVEVGQPTGSVYFGSSNMTADLTGAQNSLSLTLTRGVSLSGEVVDEETGAGIPNVSVDRTLIGPFTQGEDPPVVYYSDVEPVRTDARGKFTIMVPPQPCQIAVTSAPLSYLIPKPRSEGVLPRYVFQFDLKEGLPKKPIRFVIGRGILLTGRVLTLQKQPVAGARLYFTTTSGIAEAADLQIATTDKTGRYRVRLFESYQFKVYAVHVERKLKSDIRMALPFREGQKLVVADLEVRPTMSLRFRVAAGKRVLRVENIEVRSNTYVGEMGYSDHPIGRYNSVTPTKDGVVSYPLYMQTDIDSSGNHAIRNLDPLPKGSSYSIRISPPELPEVFLTIEDLRPGEVRDLGVIDVLAPPKRDAKPKEH